MLLVLEVLLAMALAVVVSSAASPNQVFVHKRKIIILKSFHSKLDKALGFLAISESEGTKKEDNQ